MLTLRGSGGMKHVAIDIAKIRIVTLKLWEPELELGRRDAKATTTTTIYIF
jgi:hypothetical protein